MLLSPVNANSVIGVFDIADNVFALANAAFAVSLAYWSVLDPPPPPVFALLKAALAWLYADVTLTVAELATTNAPLAYVPADTD